MSRHCFYCTMSAVGLLGGLLLFVSSAYSQQPDLILYNGKVVTVNSNFSIDQAVAITGNKITAVGSDQQVLASAGSNTQKIDLKGRTLIPGLIDTHTHIYDYALEAYGGSLTPQQLQTYPLDIRGVRSVDDILSQIRNTIAEYKIPPGQWIYFSMNAIFTGGGSVDQAKIVYDELNRQQLDKVTPNNPMSMSEGIPDFNGELLNSKAMDLLMKKHGDFIKKYGRYWIDASGQPNGHLEAPATRISIFMAPQPDPEALAPVYKKYLDEMASIGVTTVSTRLPKYSADAYKLLESRGQLTLRMAYGMEDTFGNTANLNQSLRALAKEVGTGTDKVWLNSVAPTAVDGASTRACTNLKRLTAYGSIDSWWPEGQCLTDIEFKGAAGKAAPITGNYFEQWVMASGATGLRFANTHVAGDRSVATLIGFMDRIQKRYGKNATKNWAFDHCAFVNPADLPKAAKVGVVFSCAPKYIEDNAPNVAVSYGDQVANTFIDPVKSMQNNGVRAVFETDHDVYTWHDLQLLLTRQDKRGRVWGPQERLDKTTTLKMATRWAADYVLKGSELGSIEPGKLADLLVLDKDYLTIPDNQVETIHPEMTVFDGKIIYLNPDFADQYNLHPEGAIISTYKELRTRRNPRISGEPGG